VVDKLEERIVLREAGRRLFHRQGPITVKDLDLTMVVLAQETRRSRLSKERRGRKYVAEKRNLMASAAAKGFGLRRLKKQFWILDFSEVICLPAGLCNFQK